MSEVQPLTYKHVSVSRRLQLLLQDEDDERRAIEEDADLLPEKLFASFTSQTVEALLFDEEAAGRRGIVTSETTAALSHLEALEDLGRRHVVNLFLDGLTVINRVHTIHALPQEAMMNCEPASSTWRSVRLSLLRQEAVARRQIEDSHVCFLAVALSARCEYDKQVFFAVLGTPWFLEPETVLDRSGTAIQAAWRGFLVREALSAE